MGPISTRWLMGRWPSTQLLHLSCLLSVDLWLDWAICQSHFEQLRRTCHIDHVSLIIREIKSNNDEYFHNLLFAEITFFNDISDQHLVLLIQQVHESQPCFLCPILPPPILHAVCSFSPERIRPVTFPMMSTSPQCSLWTTITNTNSVSISATPDKPAVQSISIVSPVARFLFSLPPKLFSIRIIFRGSRFLVLVQSHRNSTSIVCNTMDVKVVAVIIDH